MKCLETNVCVITPDEDLEFLYTLKNISEGKLGTFLCIKDKYRVSPVDPNKGILFEFGVPKNPFIFDAFLQFDKFILPFPKKYYEILEDEKVNNILDCSTTKELLKDGLLLFPNEQVFEENFDHKKISEKCLNLINLGIKKLNIGNKHLIAYAILADPSDYIDWLKSNKFLNNNFFYQNFEDYYYLKSLDWTSSFNVNRFTNEVSQIRMTKGIPFNIYPFKFHTKNTIYFDAYTMGLSLIADKLVNFSINSAYNYILSEFYDLKFELKTELERKNLFQVKLEYETPFGLSLILNELPTNSNPSEMYDKLLEHRKDKNYIEFKKKLNDFEESIRAKNVAEIMKYKNEVELVTKSLKDEFASIAVSNTATVSPGYLGAIYDDIISFLSGKPGLKTTRRIIDEIERNLINRKPKHLQYMHHIGEQIIASKSLEHEMNRCFSKKLNSENLHGIQELQGNLLLYSKAKDIANLIPNQSTEHFD